MKRYLFIFFIGIASGSLPAWADDSAVFARVGANQVMTDDVQPYFSSLDADQRAALAKDPALLNRTLESILIQRVIYHDAVAAKWDQQPGVAAALEQARENALVENFLTAATKPPANFPSEAEVARAYEDTKAKLIVPRQFHLTQIFIAVPKTAGPTPADAQGKLDAVTASLAQPGVDFSALARAMSDDKAGAARGGEIGWVTEDQIQPALRSEMTTLGKGKISSPIKLDDGWHILRVVDIKESYTASLNDVHDQLVRRLRAQKAQELRQAYLANLVHQNPITLSSVALAHLLPPPAAK